MRNLFTSLAVTLMLAGPVLAEDSLVVVELYTSQGCSSCPPADAFLHELAERDDVIPLAMHVDYWDYIGWKDIFARAENTKRQRAYARAGGRRMVYTPQMIINGSDQVVGNRPRDVLDVIAKHKRATRYVDLVIERIGNTLSIRGKAIKPVDGDLTVQVVRYIPSSTVAIERGENAGRTINYANVVTDLRVLGNWDTQNALSMNTVVEGDSPVVVVLQHQGLGPVAAAAQVE